MHREYFWIGGAGIVLLLDLWALHGVLSSENSPAIKGVWSAVILLLPMLGLAFWGAAGPLGIQKGSSSPEHNPPVSG
ncbi:PLDc N-terminal domain-containing protein [Pseudomonas sp. HLT2-19-2]